MILTEEQAIQIVKDNQTVCKSIKKARDYNKELSALINGDGFAEELINRIEHIESEDKAKARLKYARNIQDYFSRLLSPIQNIFSSAGGIVKFNIPNEIQYKEFLDTISNIRDGKSLSKYIQDYWVNLYHSDPNGLIFIEYSTDEGLEIKPTYKNINCIRNYEPNGQICEWVLFEPETEENGTKEWRLVDDLTDWTIYQSGELFQVSTDETFIHPFGEVPAIIISDIIDIKNKIRLSPFDAIIGLSKEYARDQSIKTIYKFLNGFPTHWRYVTQCRSCQGTGKKDNKSCPDCDGHGYYKKKDVTDMVTLPIPSNDGVKLAPDIAGYISPDLETWDQYTKELDILEKIAYNTHWGTNVQNATNETATGRFIDIQPVMNRLNSYADTAEFVEWKITELIANAVLPTKVKNESISLIVYGRRFIIDSPDVILENYNKAKRENANITILDRLFNEYLTSKYKNDPSWLREENIKASIEPYLHLSILETSTIFGVQEAKKKNYFQDWWNDNKKDIVTKSEEELKKKFESDYKQFKIQNNDDSLQLGTIPNI